MTFNASLCTYQTDTDNAIQDGYSKKQTRHTETTQGYMETQDQSQNSVARKQADKTPSITPQPGECRRSECES